MDILSGLLIGLASAVIYSFIQGCYLYFRWIRTRRFFLSEIRGAILHVNYYVATILDINMIYETEYETDHLMDHEEFISEVESLEINDQQYKKINKALQHVKDKIESSRIQAIAVPGFISKNFHAVDKIIMQLGNFISFYSFVDENDDLNFLKIRLIEILNTVEENPFPNNFLDNVKNWQNRKTLLIKGNIKKYSDKNEISDEVPF